MIDRIYEAAERLAAMPGMGRTRPELGPDYRSFPLGRVVIFYRPREGGVEILRCAHGARDIETLF